MRSLLSLLLFVACIPDQAIAQVLKGPASVADGDSFSVSGIRVRLFGVDAPELDQLCFDGEAAVACGEMAKAQLQALIGNSQVNCTRKDIDTYGRVVAVCRIGSVDLAQALVEAGWATAYRVFSDDYVRAESQARAVGVGIWQWTFQPPEDYRAAQRQGAEPNLESERMPPAANSNRRWVKDGMCLIKGNRNRRGEWIYHLPGMPYYDATRAEEYFCTETEARSAGYRRAIVR